MFKAHRIDPHKIRTLEDLRRIPFTTKQDLLPSEGEPERHKNFILQPTAESLRETLPMREKLRLLEERILHGKDSARRKVMHDYYPVFLTFTSGRSAQALPFAYTQRDLEILQIAGLRLIDVLGIPETTRTVNLFPYAPHLAFWQVTMAGFAAGRMILSTGGGKVMGTVGNVGAIRRMKASCILGVPGFVYHVLRAAQAMGATLPELETIVLGAEKVPAEFKKKVVAICAAIGAPNVKVFGTYGCTEMRMAFAECPTTVEHSSGYHSSPDLVILECIDPKTGEPAAPGADGELVITPLQGNGSLVFRYRTGDLLRGGLLEGPCPHCRRTVPRIPSRIDRVSEVADLHTTKVKGTLVNLSDFAHVLSGMHEVEEWQVELRKKNDDVFDVDELCVYVALHNGLPPDTVADRIRDRLRATTEISPNEIVFEPLDKLLARLGMETEMKERRIVDRRPKA
jgi:phenylacetate-coenzyme A ligase PaaK-like adenylate-forming protein